ncbi:MAG TPA: DUF505 domain-containing protein [Aquifex aeolicus]|nr:DUF505 domain-containing protein [Aquificales bacterium]HIQ26503.1 DUF505 domain-containing protein [Aquifex aeolicus]
MLIRKEHALALLELLEGERKKKEVAVAPEREEIFTELEFQNLAEPYRPLKYGLTYWGRALAVILEEMVQKGLIKHPSEWDETFRWLGTEIITAIADAIENKDLPGKLTEKLLEERGFIELRKEEKKGEYKAVNSYAKEIYEIFKNATPRLEISKELTEYIKKTPVGPNESGKLPEGGRYPQLLESMRLIAFSVPNSDIYAFTGLGKAVKEALNYISPSLPVLISEDILYSLVKILDEGFEALSDTQKETLWELGLVDESGNLYPAGEKLLEVYRRWKDKEYPPVKTFNIEILEAQLLKTIDFIWSEEYPKNPEVVPTVENVVHFLLEKPLKEYKHLLEYYGRKINQDFNYKKKEEIRKKFAEVKSVEELFKSFYEKGNRWLEKLADVVQEALHSLEAFNLITSQEWEGKKVYKLTEFGEKVLEDMKRRGIREISSTAVKAITITNREISAPNTEWYRQALEENLIGAGEPTVAGRLYSELAYKIRRLPHITRFELQVLHKIPSKGFFVEDVYAQFDENWKEEVTYALNKLEARGFLNILQNNAVVLTPAGELIKEALAGVPEGVAQPLTPTAVRVLEALRKVGNLYVKEEKVRILPKNIEQALKLSGLDKETFEKELVVLRVSGLIGRTSVNKAGLQVLKALELLN